ncbi:transcription termination factor NusA [Candidatus Saccharibacteria bacterium]|nr:transcription termination factor NusA [Candidatus Saccharibacteria bacterium]
MEGLDLKQMTAMLAVIAEEKGLAEEVVLIVIEEAIAAAWRRDNGERDMNVRAVLNTKSGTADVFVSKTVVEDDIAYNPATEIPQKEAGKGKNLGDIVEEKHEVKSFGRVAAQIAKQVVLQGLREAERNAVLNEFEDKIGTVVAGVVQRVESRGDVIIDLGKGSGVMPRSEQIEGEFYSVGSRIKVYIKGVDRGENRARLILSRGDAKFIDFLFRQEVPELDNGSVDIRGIVREAGRRTKIAVASTIPGVDAVGTFVGGRGIRVQAVMNEVGEREKIDVIGWSDNPSEFIREALSPAEILRVEIDGKSAKVYVSEDQQPIAIGRQGQNVRLASKLTGYEIDIVTAKPETKKKKRSKDAEDTLFSAIEEAEDSSEE